MTDLTTRHEELRPLMFSIAYGMLGSVAEAEDITQEAFLRMHREQARIESPAAYAVTVTTRLAIDQLRSARMRREVYVGSWLPEPVVAEPRSSLPRGQLRSAPPTHSLAEPGPADRAELTDRLSMAFLVLLERLSPVERAVLLLREVFEYDYERVAEIVEKSPANCRQLLARAKAHLHEERPRFTTTPAQRDALAARFFDACQRGDLAALEALLAADISFTGDGGGKAPALATPVRGRLRVARFLLGLFRQGRTNDLRVERVAVNGAPGARITTPTGDVISVLTLDIDGAAVRAVFNVLNPDKLRHL